MRSRIVPLVLVGFSMVFAAAAQQVEKGKVTVVVGSVQDELGNPLDGVLVTSDNADLAPMTISKGKFRVLLDQPKVVHLSFALKGYKTAVHSVTLNGGEVPLSVKLELSEVMLRMTAFRSGQQIEGRVDGLDPGKYGAYKVVAYVLTNKWYIHPEAVGTEGQGFALLNAQGRWKLSTVWRGYQATRLAFLLVPKDAWAPPTVELGAGDPEGALLARFTDVVAKMVSDAPEGI